MSDAYQEAKWIHQEVLLHCLRADKSFKEAIDTAKAIADAHADYVDNLPGRYPAPVINGKRPTITYSDEERRTTSDDSLADAAQMAVNAFSEPRPEGAPRGGIVRRSFYNDLYSQT